MMGALTYGLTGSLYGLTYGLTYGLLTGSLTGSLTCLGFGFGCMWWVGSGILVLVGGGLT